jgi:hypothetical protein
LTFSCYWREPETSAATLLNTHFGRHCFGARRSKTNRPQRLAAV